VTALRAGASTDTGQVRANNQDAILVAEPVFAVADGMGGHAAGEIASQVAIESLQDDDASTLAGLEASVRRANRSVWERASADPDLRGMGTTLCVIALATAGPDAEGASGDRILVANVGDSRVYQFHDGDITQITDDHSLVEDLVREGRLSPEDARTHPQRNILTRVLGNEPEVEVDVWEVVPQRGDRYLLCSDGLFNEVEDDRIAAVLRRLADPEDAAHELVSLANQHGGRDNVSVVVVDVVDDDDRAASASAALAATASVPASASATVAGKGPSTGASPLATSPPSGSWGADAGPRVPPRVSGKSGSDSRRRWVTWRSLLFVFSVVAVLGGGAAAVTWFARSTYHVGLDDQQVVIFRGRPGGLLWIEPKLAERTDLPLAEVPPSRLSAVTAGKEEPSLAAARAYVAALEDQAEAERPTTTTTSTTTSSTTTTTALTGTGSG
jgi:protein phosphatase